MTLDAPNPSGPAGPGWRVFIERVAGTSGLMLLLAGLIFFMAWNWQDMHRFLKFAVVELVFVLLAAYAFLRWKHWSADVALLGLGTAVGALLALYGQVYQTGADAWELFRAWTLALVLLTALRPGGGLAFLLWLVASLWLLLYLNQTRGRWHPYANLASLYFIAPQFAFLAVAEALARIGRRGKPRDSRRLLARAIGVLALVCLTAGAMEAIFFGDLYGGYYSTSLSTMVIPCYVAAIVVMGWVYHQRVPDLFFLSLIVFSLVSFLCVGLTKAMIESSSWGAGILLFLGACYIGLFIGGGKAVFGLRRRLHPRRAPDETQPWYMKIPLTLGIWVGSLFVVGFLAATIMEGLDERSSGFFGLCLIGLGVWLSRSVQDSFAVSQLALVALVCGLVFSGFLTDFNTPETHLVYALIFLALWLGLSPVPAKTISFAAALGALLLFLFRQPDLFPPALTANMEYMAEAVKFSRPLSLRLTVAHSPAALTALAALAAALALAIWKMNAPEDARGRLAAGALAGVWLFTMVMSMAISDHNPLWYFFDSGRYNALNVTILAAPANSVVFALAACTAVGFAKQRAAAPLLVPAGAVLSLIAWFSPGIALGLTLAATARRRGHFKLMVAGFVYLDVAVVLYYYFMGVSLLRKSIILMLTGLALLALALAARHLAARRPGRLEAEYGA